MALEFTALRLLGTHQQSRTPGVEASMLKVRGTELRQAIYETLVDIAGPHAVPFSQEAQFLEHLDQAAVDESMVAVAANCLDSRKVTIYGGTSEVQRNLIARATLDAY
jgi:alkylation response protein AidB-like acyl-CoA dehydrogenase